LALETILGAANDKFAVRAGSVVVVAGGGRLGFRERGMLGDVKHIGTIYADDVESLGKLRQSLA